MSVTLRGVTYTPPQAVTQIADIRVDGTTIYTPIGALERGRAHWFLGGANPMSYKCPFWAVTFAVVLIPCTGFLSLLLLMVKEPDTWASDLRVTDGRLTYSTTVYSRSTEEFQAISNVIAWAQQAPHSNPPTTTWALPPGS